MAARRSFAPPLLALLAAALACQADALFNISDPRFQVTVLPAGSVPPPDAARSYWYAFSRWNADSVLGALLEDGISIERAFDPLDDRCANPIGPRLTVELAHPDSGVLVHDFILGPGMLACATRLRVYTVLPPH